MAKNVGYELSTECESYETVIRMGKLHLIGNLIVDSWFDHFRYPGSQKPNPVAPIMLGEIVSWYRPYDVKDESTGMRLPPRKRFQGEALQLRYSAMSNKFGFSKKQIREAMDLLEESGVISTRLETIDTPHGRWGNVMFVSLNVDKLEEISFSPIAPRGTRVVSHEELGCSVQGTTLPIIKPSIDPVLERELDTPNKKINSEHTEILDRLITIVNEEHEAARNIRLYSGTGPEYARQQALSIYKQQCASQEKAFRYFMNHVCRRWEKLPKVKALTKWGKGVVPTLDLQTVEHYMVPLAEDIGLRKAIADMQAAKRKDAPAT